MTKPNQQQEAFRAALTELERSLESPLVPGELDDWLTSVLKAFDDLQPVLAAQLGKHKEVYQEIGEEDQELLSRVDQLADTDAKLAAQVEQLRKKFAAMESQAEEIEPRENRIHDALQNLSDEGLVLVIELRKQEAAIDTWLMEAFQRDRGPVD